jgi:hypothetical protein
MNIDDIIGYFTYRSFQNQPVGSPNDILWGEGELVLFITDEGDVIGTLAFPAESGAEQKDFMDLSGTLTGWSDLSFRFVARGRKESAISDYEYEYDCKVAHAWDSASPPQRLALVGTVRRNKDHSQAKAGATASFVAVKRDFVEPRTIKGVALIPEAVSMLSERTHRLRHTVWHTLRGDWQSSKMKDADRTRLKSLGWYLTDPPLTRERVLDLTNGAGEDFLYMHRRMIGMVRDVYEKAGQPPLTGWKALPESDVLQFAYREVIGPAGQPPKRFVLDPENSGFMIPPPTREFLDQVGGRPFFRFNKTSRGFSNLMLNVAANLRNPNVLSQLTLGAYGNLIEFTVHNWMHMRWASLSRNPSTAAPEVRDDYDVDPKWDVPQNDYLGDFHSSHVNPIFWKLHGWVDDCIEVWFTAHEKAHAGQVKRKEVRAISWFAPGEWVVKPDPFDWPGADHSHGHGSQHPGHNGEEARILEQVMAILKEVNDRPSLVASQALESERRLSGFARFSDIQFASPR